MMTVNNNTAQKQIKEYVYANYRLIEVQPGKCRFNFRCSFNAVHDAKKRGHKKIAMVVYIDNGCPIIHFVNYKKGKFKDNTLGQWTTQFEYYFVKWIDEPDMYYVNTIFANFRKHLRNQLSWWVKLTSNFEA